MLRESGKPFFAFGTLAIVFGAITVALDCLEWYNSQDSISLYSHVSQMSLVSRFFVVEGIAICLIVLGGFSVYRALLKIRLSADSTSVGSVISDALASKRDLRVGVACGLIYGTIYAVVSSGLVFQPNVNFATTYGVNSPGLSAAACCGGPGTVPALVVYLLPQAHIALQILPLGALFQIVFPILVGFNMTLVSYSLRSRQSRVTGGWIGAVAVVAGLFTGCPTCAGLFLASAFGGATATTIALALAPYQAFFIAVSLPVLVVSPILVAASLKRSMYAVCRIPRSR